MSIHVKSIRTKLLATILLILFIDIVSSFSTAWHRSTSTSPTTFVPRLVQHKTIASSKRNDFKYIHRVINTNSKVISIDKKHPRLFHLFQSSINNNNQNEKSTPPPLIPKENPQANIYQTSKSNVSYQTCYRGLNQLYPPQDLSKRNAASRSDGYWFYMKEGEAPPQHLTYGEFDFFFFAQLLDKALYYYHCDNDDDNKDVRLSVDGDEDEDESETRYSWEGKKFLDIGSGTGRLVIAAAALHPTFAKCAGIEILPSIHDVAVENLHKCSSAAVTTLGSDQHGNTISNVNGEGQDHDTHSDNPSTINGPSISSNRDTGISNTLSTDDGNDDEYSFLMADNIEPLCDSMNDMQDALQGMTAEEWRQILADCDFDEDLLESDDDDDDDDDMHLINEEEEEDEEDTNHDYTLKNDHGLVDGKEDEIINSTVIARSTPERIHPSFILPSESDLISDHEVSDDSDAIEEEVSSYQFASIEAFQELTRDEWDRMFGNGHVLNDVSIFGMNTNNEMSEESFHRDQVDEPDYYLNCPSFENEDSDTIDLPLAPTAFTCGSFEDPYEFIGDSDVIFVFSSCMKEDMMESLSQAIGLQCKPGTIIITTEFPLSSNGYIDSIPENLAMPYGEYEHKIVDKVDGYCWLTGGNSTAYIHKVVKSLSSSYGDVKRVRPRIPPAEEAWRIIQVMEKGELTDTEKFLRVVHNQIIFHGYPQSFLPSSWRKASEEVDIK